jgi:anti-sigma factor (TIGR02949 family)
MTCDSARSFLDAYVDGELDAASSLNMEEHLSTCTSCSEGRARLEALRTVIAETSPRYRAPEGLRSRILSDLRRAVPHVVTRKKPAFDWRWAAIAASVLASLLILWQIQSRRGQGQQELIAKEIVSSHVRSLMANHLVDELSTDQHNVKPWFAGKLDFSPDVMNLDAQGFMLAGARLDYLDGRPVAVIVYRRRQHVINLFVWPSSQGISGRTPLATVNGFNTVKWRSQGLLYWAISDLNGQELGSFSRAWPHE